MFKICARTVLELGAELISSDVIAFYELIKNAFDAGSRSGAEIRFLIVLRRNEYLRIRNRILDQTGDLDQLKSEIEKALDSSSDQDSRERFLKHICEANHQEALLTALDDAYVTENRILVSDLGSGMSRSGLTDNYLVIGTASRKKAIDAAFASQSEKAPYLGEKGIGRLSAMRLGERLSVETAETADKHLNVLEIDWTRFDDLDAMLDQIPIAQEKGELKPSEEWSGTRLTISSLNSDWTLDRVNYLGLYDFARLTDPFLESKSRPRIAVFWNGSRIPVARMDQHLLDHAHATAKGRLVYEDGTPTLECTYAANDLGFEHPLEVEKRVFALPDLEGAISGPSGEIPLSALSTLGPFEFEAYWYNRQRLGRIDSIGDQKTVRDLQRRWSGLLLFRDGFRVPAIW